MKKERRRHDGAVEPPMLTIEEIDEEESFKNLPHDKKLELILLIYYISLALYHSYSENDEPP